MCTHDQTTSDALLMRSLVSSNDRLADNVEQLLVENEQLMLLVLSYKREHGGECGCAICADVLRALEGNVSR